jgi:hypothetical protein
MVKPRFFTIKTYPATEQKHTIFQPAEHPRIASLPSTCPGGCPRRRRWEKWRVNGLIGFLLVD